MAKSWTAWQYESLVTNKCEPEVPKAIIIPVALGPDCMLSPQQSLWLLESYCSLPLMVLLDSLPLTNPLVQYIQLSDIQRFCHIPNGGTKFVCACSDVLIFNTSGFTHFTVYLQKNTERILTEYCFQND